MPWHVTYKQRIDFGDVEKSNYTHLKVKLVDKEV